MKKILIFALAVFFMVSCKHEPLIEETPPTVPTCDSTSVSFVKQVVPILEKHCVSCHTGSTAAGSVWLDNYSDVKTVADNGALLGSIQHSPNYSAMPQGAPKLDTCNIAIIAHWIQEGTKNN